MNPKVSTEAFDAFFAWAPLIIGLTIYAVFYVAKRREGLTEPASPGVQTFACAQCGRRGPRERMVAQDYGGATSWRCTDCAAGH